MNNQFSVTRWLMSQSAITFTFGVGIFFLITNYQGIIYRAYSPGQAVYEYPVYVQLIISHASSLFFGLATAIIIFQSQTDWHKMLYGAFEALMIFLNLNREILDTFGLNARFVLATYLAVFTGFTFYFLGAISKQHLDKILEQEQAPAQEGTPKKKAPEPDPLYSNNSMGNSTPTPSNPYTPPS